MPRTAFARLPSTPSFAVFEGRDSTNFPLGLLTALAAPKIPLFLKEKRKSRQARLQPLCPQCLRCHDIFVMMLRSNWNIRTVRRIGVGEPQVSQPWRDLGHPKVRFWTAEGGCRYARGRGRPRHTKNGDPGGSRTPNPQIRSLMLYPIELRGRFPTLPPAQAVSPVAQIERGRDPSTAWHMKVRRNKTQRRKASTRPPSTGIKWPVVQRACEPARNRMAWAQSSGSIA